MTGAEPLAEPDRKTAEGLDHVFAHEGRADTLEGQEDLGTDWAADGAETADGLTVAQAAVLLGFERRAVKNLIKEGKLCARRVKSTRSWIIDLECAHAWLQKLGFAPGDPSSSSHPGEPENKEELALPSQFSDSDGTRALWYKLDIASQQLRAASYRIGYLESQLEQYKDQVKLLPDIQAEAARTAAAEKESTDLREKLTEARAEVDRWRRPWWHRWFS